MPDTCLLSLTLKPHILHNTTYSSDGKGMKFTWYSQPQIMHIATRASREQSLSAQAATQIVATSYRHQSQQQLYSRRPNAAMEAAEQLSRLGAHVNMLRLGTSALMNHQE